MCDVKPTPQHQGPGSFWVLQQVLRFGYWQTKSWPVSESVGIRSTWTSDITLNVEVTFSLAMTYPISRTSSTEQTVDGITPWPVMRRVRLVFAVRMSSVSQDCQEDAALASLPRKTSHKRAVTTQPLDLVHKDPSVGRDYAQETKFLMLYSLIPVSNMCNYTARYISPSLLFPSLLLYLLLTHLSSFGQKEMMRVLFSPGSSILTGLTNRKGPLGFRTENPSWNSNSRKKVYKQRLGGGRIDSKHSDQRLISQQSIRFFRD